jgi:hypothetical protein
MDNMGRLVICAQWVGYILGNTPTRIKATVSRVPISPKSAKFTAQFEEDMPWYDGNSGEVFVLDEDGEEHDLHGVAQDIIADMFYHDEDVYLTLWDLDND